MEEYFDKIDFDKVDKTSSSLSGVLGINLTEELDCEELHARVWYLEPGESMARHKQETQEELDVPLKNTCQLKIAGKVVEVPRGSVVRVPPETPRQPVNNTIHQHVWLMIGAPPLDNDGVPI